MGWFDVFKRHKTEITPREELDNQGECKIIDSSDEGNDTLSNGPQLVTYYSSFWKIDYEIDQWIAHNCDPLLKSVMLHVVNSQSINISAICYKYKIGYMRAGRIIDEMEMFHVISPCKDNERIVFCSSIENLNDTINQFLIPISKNDGRIHDEIVNDYIQFKKIEPIVDIEYPRRKRIYEESVDIIQKTKDIDTFLNRIKDVNEYIEWFSKNFDTPFLSKYIYLSVDGEKVGVDRFYEEFQSMLNDNLVRICLRNFEDAKNEIDRLKQKKPKETRIINLYKIMDKAFNSVFEANNKEIILYKLEKIRLDIDELYNMYN